MYQLQPTRGRCYASARAVDLCWWCGVQVERDPWFPDSISKDIRRGVIKDYIQYYWKHIYCNQVKQNELKRRQWLREERERHSIDMARLLIHSDNTDWMHEYGDEQLLKRCPHNWFPFMVHKVSDDEMATLIKKGIQITMQEYRIEKKRYQEEAERELRRQEKEAANTSARSEAGSEALEGAYQSILNESSAGKLPRSPPLSRQSTLGDPKSPSGSPAKPARGA